MKSENKKISIDPIESLVVLSKDDEKPECINCDFCISGPKCEYCGPMTNYTNYQRTVTPPLYNIKKK